MNKPVLGIWEYEYELSQEANHKLDSMVTLINEMHVRIKDLEDEIYILRHRVLKED